MKRNKVLFFRIVPLVASCILLSLAGYFLVHLIAWGCDLNIRYNEINCAHEGIDPFDIFERKIESEKYRGLGRPDMPQAPEDDHRKSVHTYPPWHMAVFWWYGFTPHHVCIAIYAILNAVSLVWVCKWASAHLQKQDRIDSVADHLFLLAMILYPFCSIFRMMNYGLLLTGCTFLMFFFLDRKQEVAAGIVFSLVMIKPQVGVLLLIPLFINKYYKVVAIAGAICILETLFTSWKLDKSPIELILQIPRIGAPFPKGFFAEIAMKIFGPFGQHVVMGAFIGLAAAGCYFVRNARELWVRFIPAIAVVPFWTYSKNHDWFILLPCFIYLLNDKQKHPRLYELCFWSMILWSVVSFSHSIEWYLIGKQGLASILFFAMISSCCIALALDTMETSDWKDWKGFRWLPCRRSPSDQ